MDNIINKISGNHPPETQGQTVTKPHEPKSSWEESINSKLGGGKASEKNEDLLDKGVDAYQQYILHEGPQNDESAFEQGKDEAISDAIRRGFKNVTGHDIPIKDKS